MTTDLEAVAVRMEAAAARAEAAAARAEAARGGQPAGQPNVNSVTCEVCGHVGAPMPDGICPNNNCPTRK